jgi:hypothetical protein
MCPFLKVKCIEGNCKLWIGHPEPDCAILQLLYTVSLIKEDKFPEIIKILKKE